MRALVLALALLSASAFVFAAQPPVETQVPGIRPTVTVSVAGTIHELPAAALSDVRVGVASLGVDFPRSWTPAGHVNRDGSFAFTTRLTEGDYEVVAALGRFEAGFARIHVAAIPRDQSFAVKIEPRRSTFADSELHYDAPPDLPPVGLIPNPEEPEVAPRPAPPPPGSGWDSEKNNVRVFYATNRRLASPRDAGPQPVAERLFGDEPDQLRFGYYDVAVTFKRAPRYNPLVSDQYQFRIYSIHLYSDAVDFGSGLTRDAPRNATNEALLFIHGYNTPFEDGIYRTAQLAVELDFRGLPIYFAWPGGEHWWEYLAAVDQVETAANELAAVLRLLVRNGKVTKLHVIAHSLGNRVLAQAIDKLGAVSTPGQAKIADLVMVAPDVNKGQFTQVTSAMVRQFQRRTVYVSDTDLALRLSSVFSMGTRVGQRTPIGVGSEFEAVDATGARDTIIGHSYFVDTDTIAKDISALVVRGMSAAQRGLTNVRDNGATVWQLPK